MPPVVSSPLTRFTHHSIDRYDNNGTSRAFGAEANLNLTKAQAEDEQWELARHFKLHLHPAPMRSKDKIDAPPLPRGVTLQRIYADFFGYLYRHASSFFQAREINGSAIWEKLKLEIEFVIATPNGWGSHEQAFLREAAVMGGLTSEREAKKRVFFLSEAEASVHFVMVYGDMSRRLEVCEPLLLYKLRESDGFKDGCRLSRLRRWRVYR
jgi:hypothetical protein